MPAAVADVERQKEQSVSANAAATEPASRKEIWGWYLWDFGANAFYSAALPVFFPLLLTSMANTQAYAELGQSVTPSCSATSNLPCLVCVPGLGTQLNTTQGLQSYPQPQVTAGALRIDPVAYATIMAGLAVLAQVLAFVTFGPLADYGHGRKHMLIGGTVLGSAMCLLSLVLVSPSLWWLGGVLLVLGNVGMGLSTICYYSYLAVLVEASPEVLEADAQGQPKRELMAVRERVSNRISLNSVGIGSVGAILSIVLAAGLTFTTPDTMLQLRLAIASSGVWWIGFSIFAFAWLKARPAPPPPSGALTPWSGWTALLQLIREASRCRNAFSFLLCYFIYADGYITLTQVGVLYGQRMLCMENTALLVLVASVSLWATLGAVLFFWVQRWTGLRNKAMVVLVLSLMLPLPLWGLLGYLTPEGSIGMKNVWEVYVFAGWFGILLGPIISFSRTLFIDMIPVGTEARFFSLYSICDKGSSWVGPFVIALVVQVTGQLRPSFLYVLVVMLVPLIMLILLVDHEKGLEEAGRAQEQTVLPAVLSATVSDSGNTIP